MSAPRLLGVLGAKAGAEIVEEFVGPAEGSHAGGSTLTNAVAEFRLSDDAHLKHGCAASFPRDQAGAVCGWWHTGIVSSMSSLTHAACAGNIMQQSNGASQPHGPPVGI